MTGDARSAATTPVDPTREEKLEVALWQIVNNAEAWHGDDAAKGRALAVIALTGRTALKVEQAKEREGEYGRSRMVPDGRGGTRPARGTHDYGETPL